MVLLLVVHTVENVTAKVPFATILLQDLVAQKKTGEHKCRQLVPTSGARSSSLWDTDDAAALLAWLQESCGAECTHEAFEVQEDFGIGLGEVSRARTAERVRAGVHDLDKKLKISEGAGHAADAVRENATVQSATAALSKAGASVKEAAARTMEKPAVKKATETAAAAGAATVDALGDGARRLGAGLSSLAGRVRGQAKPASTAAPAPSYALGDEGPQ